MQAGSDFGDVVPAMAVTEGGKASAAWIPKQQPFCSLHSDASEEREEGRKEGMEKGRKKGRKEGKKEGSALRPTW